MTLAADKAQAFVGAVLFGRIAASGAHLTRIVGIHIDAQTSCQTRLVVQEGMQFSKRPFAGMSVGSALLLAGLFAIRPFGPVPDALQVFQADERMGMGIKDLLAYQVIHIQLKPSLSPAKQDTLFGRRASAFLPKSFL